MTGQPAPKPPRAILASFPKQYSVPGKPAGASAAALDAHRQTGFLLGDELALFERGMNAVLSLVAADSKMRGPRASGMISVGSRTFEHLADACTLMCQGSYASCMPLLRMLLECVAIQRALVADEFGPYEEWYEHAISQEGAAVRIDLGHSKAASVLAADDRLGELYRLLMDLSMPHFGSALLFSAPETSLQKVPLAFADSSFHLGLAQLITGWLLMLGGEQLTSWLASGLVDANETHRADADADVIKRDTAEVLADARRCYVERIDDRWVFHNFRRAPSGQPKRIVLG